MKSTFRVRIGLLAFVLVNFQAIALAKVEAVIGSRPAKSNINLPMGFPQTPESEILISRPQYLISYNKFKRAPNWVSWTLEEKDLGNTDRSLFFYEDNDLNEYLKKQGPELETVKPSDYNGSCFDRGHQIPSADRTDSVDDNLATFTMSNIIPQTPYLNRVVWAHLEIYTRNIVRHGKKAIVITGPIYDQNFGFIGPKQDIPVPSKNFKIISLFEPRSKIPSEVIAVIMPNLLEDGSIPTPGHCPNPFKEGPADFHDWKKYRTTVKEIERLSGIQFPSSLWDSPNSITNN